ncbi:hypothetical protein M413DRAFT_443506, partial [Hebeloma cylindrosporum]
MLGCTIDRDVATIGRGIRCERFYREFVTLIAAAFDAAASHNAKYQLPGRTNPLLGITFCRSWPRFLKSQSPIISRIVWHPTFSFVVHFCVTAYSPSVTRPLKRLEEGMKPLKNRLVLLTALLQFKYMMMFHLSGDTVFLEADVYNEDGRDWMWMWT